MKRVAIVGHFGGNEKFNDGQTVKSITLYEAILKEVDIVDKIDTYYIKKNPFLFLLDFFKMVVLDKKIIILLSSNGRRVLFPVFYYLSRYFRKEIYHYGIGGRLAREASENKNIKKYISQFTGNWMESRLLVQNLSEIGVNNAIYVPNFKKLTRLMTSDLTYHHIVPYKFCIFSRIMKEKGVEDAIYAINEINNRFGRCVAKLDIYGPIDNNYKYSFSTLIQHNDNCEYCGVIDASKSVDVLKDYYCLLFPTHWRHEGIPGTIIDALSAGIPVISREWQYCTEMLEHKKTGLIYEFDKPELLIEMIEYSITHPSEIENMKVNCLGKADEYREENVIKQICELMKL